jgi:hypothetical protein
MKADQEQTLPIILVKRQAVLSEMQRDANVMRRFLDSDQMLMRRFLASNRALMHRATTDIEAPNPTCTGFCLYYLAGAGLIEKSTSPEPFNTLSDAEARQISAKLGKEIVRSHSKRSPKSEKQTDVGDLPNHYNSSLQMAGYLRSSRYLNSDTNGSTQRKCKTIAEWLTEQILKNRGFASQIGYTSTPSAYLTYWTGVAIQEYLTHPKMNLGHSDCKRMKRALIAITNWGGNDLSNKIAYHHSGIGLKFDVIELVYAALCAIQFGVSGEAEGLARHGIRIVLNEYISNGCFTPSAPVLADRKNFSLQCPTAEALSLLLLNCKQVLFGEWQALCAVSEWLQRNRVPDGLNGSLGWRPEREGWDSAPTAFMTASAVSFLAGLAHLLDDVVHRDASVALEPFFISAKSPDGYRYPEGLADVIQQHIIQPIRGNPPRPKLASFSMILYGPPGTSKTTIAKELAQDLEWPLLVVNQNAFLSHGFDNIDREADRLFRLISYLKETVVLFDEVEELVQARETTDKTSRILTTAMLPRIAELRDRHRIVFIFATNRAESIDDAIARLGRFDMIRCIMPPTRGERSSMLDGLFKKYDIPKLAVKLFRKARLSDQTENFGYTNLEALVKYIQVETIIKNRKLDEKLINKALDVYKRSVDSAKFKTELEGFRKYSAIFDRP